MWRMFGWLGRTVATALIVSFLAIWTTGYIVNSYVETLLRQYNLPLETKPMALSGVWGTLWGVDATGKGASMTADTDRREPEPAAEEAWSAADESSDDPADAVSDEADVAAGGDADTTAEPDGADDAAEGPASDARDPDAAEETGSGTGTTAHGGAQQGETIITPGDLAAARDQMSEEDRNKLFAILVSKLPQEEWQTISAYVESGLTESELTNVQQIVAKYLNREEYDELMEILSKY